MFHPINRRGFLKSAVGVAAGLSLSSGAPFRAFAQARIASIVATKLTDSISLISGAGSNVLVVNGPDGVLMVNGGLPEHSAELLAAVAQQSGGRPVQALFNTDWHLDNTGANDAIGKTGAKIIAHENTKLWMGFDDLVIQWQHKTYPARAKEARPNQTFYTSAKMTFGKEEIRYGHLGQAHTDGDIYVFLPGPNILMTGDVFTVGSYPIMDWSTGGWIRGLSDASKTLLNLTDAQTRVIPGTGPIQARADLQAQADMTGTMTTRLIGLMAKGMNTRDMVNAAPTKEFDARWGDPTLFLTNAYPGLWNHVRELQGSGII